MDFIKFNDKSAESIVCAVLFWIIGLPKTTKNPNNVFEAFNKCRDIVESKSSAEKRDLPKPKLAGLFTKGKRGGDGPYPNLFYYISDKESAKEFRSNVTTLFSKGFASRFGELDGTNADQICHLLVRTITEEDIEEFVLEGARDTEDVSKVLKDNEKLERENKNLLAKVGSLSANVEDLQAVLKSNKAQIQDLLKENKELRTDNEKLSAALKK